MDHKAGDVVTLAYPVELKNAQGEVLELVDSVRLRRLNGADFTAIANAAEKGKGEAAAVMVCRVGQVPRSTFDKLDAEDVAMLSEIAASFMGGARKTGGG